MQFSKYLSRPGAVLLSLLVAAGIVGVVPAALASPTGASASRQGATTSCLLARYDGRTVVTSIHRTIGITHASNVTIPRGWHDSVTRTARHRSTLNVGGSFRGEAGASAGIPLRLIGVKVHAKYSVSVHANYTRTTSGSVKVTRHRVNVGKADRTFVFFRGYWAFHGGFKKSYCVKRASNHSAHPKYGVVVWFSGKWHTYATGVTSTGAVGCGGSSSGLDAVARKAKRVYCA